MLFLSASVLHFVWRLYSDEYRKRLKLSRAHKIFYPESYAQLYIFKNLCRVSAGPRLHDEIAARNRTKGTVKSFCAVQCVGAMRQFVPRTMKSGRGCHR